MQLNHCDRQKVAERPTKSRLIVKLAILRGLYIK